MGVVKNVSHNAFPKQGTLLNQRVDVMFNYDSSRTLGGTCVRDDTEAPFITIFLLDDGRHILSTECQYQYR